MVDSSVFFTVLTVSIHQTISNSLVVHSSFLVIDGWWKPGNIRILLEKVNYTLSFSWSLNKIQYYFFTTWIQNKNIILLHFNNHSFSFQVSFYFVSLCLNPKTVFRLKKNRPGNSNCYQYIIYVIEVSYSFIGVNFLWHD